MHLLLPTQLMGPMKVFAWRAVNDLMWLWELCVPALSALWSAESSGREAQQDWLLLIPWQHAWHTQCGQTISLSA